MRSVLVEADHCFENVAVGFFSWVRASRGFATHFESRPRDRSVQNFVVPFHMNAGFLTAVDLGDVAFIHFYPDLANAEVGDVDDWPGHHRADSFAGLEV